MRYLLITEPRTHSSVRVDMLDNELPEDTLARFLDGTSLVARFNEESEMVGLIEWYESETNDKVEVINEGRHVAAPDPNELAVRRMVKPLGAEEWTTGGGCMAWRIHIRDGNPEDIGLHALITDDDGTHHIGDPDAPIWMIGLYGHDDKDDGEGIETHTNLTLPVAVAKVYAWKEKWK